MRSLVKKSEFQKVYEDGVKHVGRFLVVYLLSATDTAVAVVASRKVGSAVKRNRAKRLLREAARCGVLGQQSGIDGVRKRFFPETGDGNASRNDETGLWVVLVARVRILQVGFHEVREELETLLGESCRAKCD